MWRFLFLVALALAMLLLAWWLLTDDDTPDHGGKGDNLSTDPEAAPPPSNL